MILSYFNVEPRKGQPYSPTTHTGSQKLVDIAYPSWAETAETGETRDDDDRLSWSCSSSEGWDDNWDNAWLLQHKEATNDQSSATEVKPQRGIMKSEAKLVTLTPKRLCHCENEPGPSRALSRGAEGRIVRPAKIPD